MVYVFTIFCTCGYQIKPQNLACVERPSEEFFYHYKFQVAGLQNFTGLSRDGMEAAFYEAIQKIKDFFSTNAFAFDIFNVSTTNRHAELSILPLGFKNFAANKILAAMPSHFV